MLESILANHCAPALAGIKPSNLVSCFKDKMPNVKEDVKELNRQLNSKDIYIDVLCECPKRVLLIVYRKEKLLKHLRKPEIAQFLASYGYDAQKDLKENFEILSTRINCDKDFPHEIGAFLGYPLEDIHGFIEFKGRDCLYSGEWKVYSDLDGAKRMFSRFKSCKRAIVNRVEQGKHLPEIFCAA